MNSRAMKSHLIPSDDEIIKILYEYNPWWLNKPIPLSKLKEFKRRDYYKTIPRRIEDNLILALMGPRRVGKSTLIYQFLNYLISQINVDRKRILFFSLDEYLLTSLSNLSKIFEVYSLYVLKEQLNELSEKVYILIDEIQSVQNWEIMLKKYFDLGYKMKFVVTGSSSPNILKKSSESLVGRIHHQIILPMKFYDYISFKETKNSVLIDRLRGESKNMRDALKQVLIDDDTDQFYKVILESYNTLLPIRDLILLHLDQYFIKGGYPEIINTDDLTDAASLVGNYLHLTIYRDIMRMKLVRDPIALENLFRILTKQSSCVISRSSLAQTLGLKRDTLNSYIYILKNTFLISEAEFYSASRVSSSRKEKKFFINDIGIRNFFSSTFYEQIRFNSNEMGKIAETIIADHSKRLKYNLEPFPNPQIFYWKDKYEVDLIISPSGKVLPIEVKYQENINPSDDLKGIIYFRKKFRPIFSFMITKNLLRNYDSVFFIPLWLYLIMC